MVFEILEDQPRDDERQACIIWDFAKNSEHRLKNGQRTFFLKL